MNEMYESCLITFFEKQLKVADGSLTTFVFAMMKCSNHRKLKDKEFLLAYNLYIIIIYMSVTNQKEQWSELEGAGHANSTVKRQ